MRRLLLAGGIAASAMLGLAAVLGGVHLASTVPAPQLSLDAPAEIAAAPGTAPTVTAPSQGSMAIEAAPGERLASVAAEDVRPIGSVTKVMTALAVLSSHPLAPAEQGPLLTMTDADVKLFHDEIARDGSALPVHVGEQLSEHDLLLALLLPSANNAAETLAVWVSGSRQAFIASLNATAVTAGMSHTHFDDPSGFSSASVSTASDLLLLGRAALASPTIAAIVATAQASLSDGTVVHNRDTLLGIVPGWLGIKTGETPQAGACLLFAARRPPSDGLGGPPVTLIGAVLGQTVLGDAFDAARRAVDSAMAGYITVRPGALIPAKGAAVTTVWDVRAPAHVQVEVDPNAPAVLTLLRGTNLRLVAGRPPLRAPLRRGDEVGAILGWLGTQQVVAWSVRLDGDLPGPSLTWRLLYG
jgi:D-alanyl-D-alanine carboxypeptidase (penicillin-binding protein 5/6)